MSDDQKKTSGDYLQATAFIKVGADAKVQPRSVGYAKKKGDKLYVTLQLIPTPGQGWDGSIVIEKKQERDDGRSSSSSRDARDDRDDRRGSR